MNRILAPKNKPLLAQFSWSKVLLAFDFDGTLAPIVADRDKATMRNKTSLLFSRLCQLYPCVVISGRSKADVSGRLGNAAVKFISGNHGLEPGTDLEEFGKEISATKPLLESGLSDVQGIDVEDKRYSLAIHYRRSRQKRLARESISRVVSTLPSPMRVVLGKMVVNVVPARAPNKGDALLDLREKEGADTALYIGDDVTDEDVFRLDQPGRLLSIRVGESKTTAAKYFLRDQREIDTLLGRLVTLRESETTSDTTP